MAKKGSGHWGEIIGPPIYTPQARCQSRALGKKTEVEETEVTEESSGLDGDTGDNAVLMALKYAQMLTSSKSPTTEFQAENNIAISVNALEHRDKDFSESKMEFDVADDEDNYIMSNMLERLAGTDAFLASQQLGDPDLTQGEKVSIAKDILLSKPVTFLSRFGKHLCEEDLPYFESLRGDYMIDFHLGEIQKQLDERKNKVKVRNRRFEAMQQLLKKGEYFSDEELKSRDPLLYEQMIGQYLNEDEITSMVDTSDLRFSNILFKHMDILQNNIIYNIQQEYEESQMEEEEDSDGSFTDEMDGDKDRSENGEIGPEKAELPKVKIDPAEKLLLRNEFLRTMQLRFLNGEDSDFNYSEVDGNVEYDCLDIRGRDEEEKYFDNELPEYQLSQNSNQDKQGCETDNDDLLDYEKYDTDKLQLQEDAKKLEGLIAEKATGTESDMEQLRLS